MRRVGIVALLVVSTGCAGPRVMMPTPNVQVDPKRDVYAELHPELKSTEVPLFYVTDRAPEENQGATCSTGTGVPPRSPSVPPWWT